jgi:glycosyltransferase involved in cell wall biosynthesis
MNLDIIIPTYNAKKTLNKTLASIAIQKGIETVNVYLINDASDYDYNEFIKYYSNFYNIKEIKLKKNSGPGTARKIGLENSHSKYIIFIDSDDYFYTPLSLLILYNKAVETNSDILTSNFLYERDNEKCIKTYNTVWLHGKIYKREFLEKNNITFNNTRANEDNGFNRLVLLSNPNSYYYPEITYVYSENKDSITRKNNRAYRLDGLEGYTYNLNWAMKEGLKRNLSKREITYTALEVLIYMYHYYMELVSPKVIKWSKETFNIYNSIKDNLSEIEIEDFIKHVNPNTPINEEITFKEFLEMVGNYND